MSQERELANLDQELDESYQRPILDGIYALRDAFRASDLDLFIRAGHDINQLDTATPRTHTVSHVFTSNPEDGSPVSHESWTLYVEHPSSVHFGMKSAALRLYDKNLGEDKPVAQADIHLDAETDEIEGFEMAFLDDKAVDLADMLQTTAKFYAQKFAQDPNLNRRSD